MKPKVTDWDAYYIKPASAAAFTRRISAARILRTLGTRLHCDEVRICELGGANSCFIDDFLRRPGVASYDVLDSNSFGIGLLNTRLRGDQRVKGTVGDALTVDPGTGRYDIVYSVGLIEHFDEARTARCIESHFHLCRPGGTVLITFPTPTIPYRLIRGAAEIANMWKFPDERPLQFYEVEAVCRRYGEVQHKSINWAIGLTQGYVLTRAHGGTA